MSESPLSERSPVQMGLVVALVGGIFWCLGKWSDVSDKYQTKELATAQAATQQAQIEALKSQIAGVEKSLAGQFEALRAEVRASDRAGK